MVRNLELEELMNHPEESEAFHQEPLVFTSTSACRAKHHKFWSPDP